MLMKPLTLYELNHLVRKTINNGFYETVWLQSELIDVRQNSNGHCYLEFIQKSNDSGTIIAKAKGQVWSNNWKIIQQYFEKETGMTLSAGMQVMVEVEVTFSEIYGYSLSVVDINPTFTLGDIARRRREIIMKLKEEGVADMNKELPLPTLLQNIAVISTETAAGWGDFRNQLSSNKYGLKFNVQLFPAIMQGENVEPSIIQALNTIATDISKWDAVVIIRGGGATSDLYGFDSLLLAENIAQFPLPIITGIGHERDDTIIDLISHTRVKTPTAAAEFIIHHQLENQNDVKLLEERLMNAVYININKEKIRIDRYINKIPTLFNSYKTKEENKLNLLQIRYKTGLQNIIVNHKHKIALLETKLQSNDPIHVMKLGYSIIRHNGKAINDVSQLEENDIVDIHMAKGTTKAKVIK